MAPTTSSSAHMEAAPLSDLTGDSQAPNTSPDLDDIPEAITMDARCKRLILAAKQTSLAYNVADCSMFPNSMHMCENCTDCTDCLVHCAGTDADVVISSSEDVLAVAFRGTTSFRDWLFNLKLLWRSNDPGPPAPTRFERRYVHRGFAGQWHSVRNQVVTDVKRRLELGPKPKYLLVTGHSLGGAMAVIATPRLAEIAKLYGVDTSLVTFGQPRVGNNPYSKHMKSLVDKGVFTYDRIVHDQDIVPLLPPRWLGWVHVPGDWILLKDDSTRSLLIKDRWSLFRDSLHVLNGVRKFDLGISDHSTNWYSKGIKSICELFTRGRGLLFLGTAHDHEASPLLSSGLLEAEEEIA